MRDEQYAAAAARYEKAAKLFPAHARAWRGLAHALLQLGRAHDAARAFDQAIGLAPDSATTLWGGAVAHAAIGNAIVAHSYLRRTLGLQPTWIEMARQIPQLAVFLQTSTRAGEALREAFGAFSARTYRHAGDPTRSVDVGRIVNQPAPEQLTFVTLGLSNHVWAEPQRPRVELVLASTVEHPVCAAILSNLAFHLAETGVFPEPGVMVRDVVGSLGVHDISQRLPHVFLTVPRRWSIGLPIHVGPPAITLAQAVPVSEREYEVWADDPETFELALAVREVEAADLRRQGT